MLKFEEVKTDSLNNNVSDFLGGMAAGAGTVAAGAGLAAALT
ncbi:hypothetical protein ACUW92_002398 [Staphylococcus epidermidis]|nr:hypothetical protein [Staphylococcus epidermidis]MDS3941002.1 hypothetical protein [Staphylococcus epidermidis]